MPLRLCRCCEGWHDLDKPWPHNCASHWRETGPRSDVAGPIVIRDGMDAIQSMADGKWYESKSAMRREYKARGYQELGNDAPREARGPSKPKVTRDDVGRALAKVKAGYKPTIHPDTGL